MCGCIVALILILALIVFVVWLVLRCAGGLADSFVSGVEWFVQTFCAVLNGEQIPLEAAIAFIFVIVFLVCAFIIALKKCKQLLRR